MIRLVIIAIIIALVVMVLLLMFSPGTSDEQEYDDNAEADYEAGPAAENTYTTEPADSSGSTGVTPAPETENGSGSTIITGTEARALFESDDSVILLDVRNQDEYDAYHILDSILIPVDELESRLSELPDKDALIIVYCRSGRRSAIAADLLVSKGYTNVHDMQGIENW